MKTTFNVSLILLSLGLCVASVFAQNGNRKGGNFGRDQKFFIDVLDYYSGNPDSTLVSAFIEVPYDRVQFFKTGNSFSSNFTITISIFDEDKEHLITENTWDEKVTAKDFDQTVSKSNYNVSLKSFKLTPDKYSVRASVDDNNSKNTFVQNKDIEVRKFSDNLDISDIMLVAKEANVDGERKIIPNVSRNVIVKKAGIPVFYEINTNEGGKFRLIYSINTKSSVSSFQDTADVNLNKGKNQIYYDIKDSSLNLGTYTVNINAENLTTGDEASVSSNLISRWSGVPENVTDLDLAIRQLVYIATPGELDYINKASNREEKIKRFAQFWKKKDPNPSDEENQAFDEYYNRVAYANDHFSRYREGWKTDMGMVYIVLGKPDNVEHHPFDPDSKPYEIWDYYDLNVRLAFLDQTGFGDYRLMNPLDFDYVRHRVDN